MTIVTARGEWVVLVVQSICAAILFVSTILTIWAIGPTVENRWFPVVGKLQITSMQPAEDGGTQINAVFRTMRDCEYIGIAWYLGTPSSGEFERVPVQILRRTDEMASGGGPVGMQRVGPWVIGVSPNDLEQNSFAILSHKCHPFWLTTTNFYP